MNPEQLYNILQLTLADEKVKAEITARISAAAGDLPGQTELFPRDDTLSLSAENTELSRRLALCELEISRLQSENTALTARLRSVQGSLDSCLSVYGMQMSLYERFKSLSPAVAAAVKGYFKNSSPAGLFLCGVQPDNLKGFRDYTERLVIEGDGSATGADISVLDSLYTYLLGCYNSTFTSPVYTLTDVRPGDTFDPSVHHNTGLAKSGSISAVRLQGCIASGSRRIIRKAIVEI